MPVPEEYEIVWPIRRTGSLDNERIQINNALKFLINKIDSLESELNQLKSNTNEQFDLIDTNNILAINGIPEGGTTGQTLAKVSDDDYDTEWVT